MGLKRKRRQPHPVQLPPETAIWEVSIQGESAKPELIV
jgi:hypothetical protein